MNWKTTEVGGHFEEFSKMSENEKRIYHLIDDIPLPYKREVALYDKGNNKVLAYKMSQWHFIHNKFFIKSRMAVVATITPNRIYADDVNWAGRCLCKYLGLDCWNIHNKRVLRDIVKRGKAAMDEYIAAQRERMDFPVSEWDMKHYTEDGLDSPKFKERYLANVEFRDLFRQAIQLDRKIKISWSDRKVHDIHMKWTEEIQKIKSRNCSTEPIWNIDYTVGLPENVELLNSEKRIAEEGQKMHHCIYTVYNSALVAKRYIAFHVDDFTVMFSIDRSGNISFDQAYKAWDKNLSKEEMEYAKAISVYATRIIRASALNDMLSKYIPK